MSGQSKKTSFGVRRYLETEEELTVAFEVRPKNFGESETNKWH